MAGGIAIIMNSGRRESRKPSLARDRCSGRSTLLIPGWYCSWYTRAVAWGLSRGLAGTAARAAAGLGGGLKAVSCWGRGGVETEGFGGGFWLIEREEVFTQVGGFVGTLIRQ